MDWSIYRDNIRVAVCADIEDAVFLVSNLGGQIKFLDRFLVWTEGQEEFSAQYYDIEAIEIILKRACEQEADDYARQCESSVGRVYRLADYRK